MDMEADLRLATVNDNPPATSAAAASLSASTTAASFATAATASRCREDPTERSGESAHLHWQITNLCHRPHHSYTFL